jgi:hypothetical protein
MKARKLAALILLSLLLFVFTACSEQLPGEAEQEEQQNTPYFFRWWEEGTLSYDFEWLGEYDYELGDNRGRFVRHGENWVIISEIDMYSMGYWGSMTMRTMLKDGGIYYVFDEYESYGRYVKIPDERREAALEQMMNILDGSGKVGEGYDDFNGKFLPYEDYGYGKNGEIIRYFFVDNEVYGISNIFEDGERDEKLITNVTNIIPEGVFDIPAYYDNYEDWMDWDDIFED